MEKTNSQWKKEFLGRLLKFAVRIIIVANNLPKTPAGFAIASQLIKSGTSIGANAEEAQDASSLKDFIQKMSISLREAKETRYWLRIIRLSKLLPEGQVDSDLVECEEIIAILISTVKSSKNKLNKNG